MTPTLPDNILKLQLHPVIRVLRVVGGLSTLLLITDRVRDYSLPIYVYIIAIVVSIVFLIYHIYITYYRIIHMYKVLKSDQLNIRNSPLHRVASLCSKLIFCAKGACDAVAPVGVTLGIMGGIDGIRQSKGLKPVFIFFL